MKIPFIYARLIILVFLIHQRKYWYKYPNSRFVIDIAHCVNAVSVYRHRLSHFYVSTYRYCGKSNMCRCPSPGLANKLVVYVLFLVLAQNIGIFVRIGNWSHISAKDLEGMHGWRQLVEKYSFQVPQDETIGVRDINTNIDF